MNHLLWGFFAHTNFHTSNLIRRQRFQALASLSLALLAGWGLSGCSNSPAKSQSSQTPVISLTITETPPTRVITGSSSQVSATVAGDPAGAGVDWVATCASAPNCGSFNPAHSDSGTPTVFTAPTAVPTKATVTVTALSSTDHSKFAVFTVSIVSTVNNIVITKYPPASAASGSTVSATAVVVGDPANLGVDWKANCGGVDCTPPAFHSGSGVPVNFPIPSIFQNPNIVGESITLTAYAAADHSFSVFTSFVVAPQVMVDITQLPPSTLQTNATATLIAVVENDPTNAGVNWSVSCATPPCGTVVPAHTASGASTVYTAPPVVPGDAQNPNPSVNIVAQAAASPSATLVANVTILAPVSIQLLQGVSNGTIVQGSTASLIATVAGDPANAGVDWSVNCGSPGSCGSFSLSHTASGATTVYTAPPSIPTGGTITITAASTTDPTKTVSQTATVTAAPPPNSLLTGQFVMLLTSNNSANGAFVVGGVLSGDGNGAIQTAFSLFDLVDASGNLVQGIPLTSGSYSIGADGRGLINLQLPKQQLNSSGFGINGSGALNLSVAFVSPQHAILSESDSFGTATGTLDLQNYSFTGSLNPGVYTLALSGSERARPTAGFLIYSALTIPASPAHYSYTSDQSDGGVITSVPYTTDRSAFPNLSSNAPFYYSLSSLDLGLPNQYFLHLWPIDNAHFVVTDLDAFTETPSTIIGGHLTAQPSSPSVSGTYAFTLTGATATAQPQVVGGILTCGSAGVLDIVPLSGTPLTNQSVSASCGPVSNGRGVIALTGAASSGINQFAAYPTVDPGTYVIELDGGATGTSGSSGFGLTLQQTLTQPIAASALNGNYASTYNATTALGSQAFAGVASANGTSALNGTVDVDSFNANSNIATPSLGATISGTYTASTNGRFQFPLVIAPATGQPAAQVPNLNFACYVVDSNTCLLLDLDATALGTGILQLQNLGL